MRPAYADEMSGGVDDAADATRPLSEGPVATAEVTGTGASATVTVTGCASDTTEGAGNTAGATAVATARGAVVGATAGREVTTASGDATGVARGRDSAMEASAVERSATGVAAGSDGSDGTGPMATTPPVRGRVAREGRGATVADRGAICAICA